MVVQKNHNKPAAGAGAAAAAADDPTIDLVIDDGPCYRSHPSDQRTLN